MTDADLKADMAFLTGRPEFRRFMWRAIQSARIFEAVADGSEGRNLDHYEGRRSLVLELLRDAERGQPVVHPDQIPILTAIQILREEAQQQPTKDAKDRQRYDRTADLSEPDDEHGA